MIIAITYILMSILCSCKGDEEEVYTAPEPEITAHGDPEGMPTGKSIGPEGGLIQTPDGSIRLEIPEGAVALPTTFTIQPVTQKLESSTGTAYRLGPENISFQKDVRITFSYTDEDLVGTTANDLYLAYQDAEGYWHRAFETDIDEVNKKLTVQTRHFSDWTIERTFYIDYIDGKTQLSAGEKTGLIVFVKDVDKNGNLLSSMPVPNKNIDTWFVNGAGNLDRLKMESVTFTAPSAIESPQTVAVGVRIKNMVDRRNPDRPGNTGLVILQVPLELLPDEYFTWETGGAAHTGVSMDAARLGSVTQLVGTGLTGGVNLSVNASKAGSYELGSAVNPDTFGIQVLLSRQNHVIYQGEYYVCGEPVPRYGKGKLTITRYGKVGEKIEGYFTATVYSPSTDCRNLSKLVTGKFRIRRMQ